MNSLTAMNYFKFGFIFSFLISLGKCSHFYGGIISWKATDTNAINNINVLIQWRFYWRSTMSSNHRCDDNKIINGDLIGDSATIDCATGCTPTTFSIDSKVICSDYSLTHDWSGGQRSTLVTFSNPVYVEGIFSGGAWLTLNIGGNSWELRFKMDLNKRGDIQRINSPPTCLVNPITTMRIGCENTLKIYTADRDGDKVKCRWSNSSMNECAGICNAVPGSQLDEEKCVLTFTPPSTGYYAVAIQIEDFSNSLSTSPFSSIPVQFLINSKTLPCVYDKLQFQQPTLKDEACTAVKFNQTYHSKLIVFSNSQITEFSTLSPPGLIKSKIDNYNNNQSLWYVNLTWPITDPDLIGINLFCFEAINVDGDKTDQRCVSLVVDGISPIFQNPSPTGLVDPDIPYFTINAANVPITKSTRSGSFIRIFDSNDTQVIEIESVSSNVAVINSKTLIFSIDFNFTQGESYYVLFDTDVAQSNQYCGLESLPISNKTFWMFTIKTDQSTIEDNSLNKTITNITNNLSNESIPFEYYKDYVANTLKFYKIFLKKSTIAIVSTLGGSILLSLIFIFIIGIMSCVLIKLKKKSSISPITKINVNTNHISLKTNHLESKQIDSFNSHHVPIALIEDMDELPTNSLITTNQPNQTSQQTYKTQPAANLYSNPNEVKPKKFVRDATRFNYKENPDSFVVTKSNLFGYQSVSVAPKCTNLKIIR